MDRAAGVEAEVPTENAMREICLVAKTVLQLVNRGARQEVERVVRLVSDGHLGAGDLRRPVKESDDCQQILDGTRDERPADDGLKK